MPLMNHGAFAVLGVHRILWRFRSEDWYLDMVCILVKNVQETRWHVIFLEIGPLEAHQKRPFTVAKSCSTPTGRMATGKVTCQRSVKATKPINAARHGTAQRQ